MSISQVVESLIETAELEGEIEENIKDVFDIVKYIGPDVRMVLNPKIAPTLRLTCKEWRDAIVPEKKSDVERMRYFFGSLDRFVRLVSNVKMEMWMLWMVIDYAPFDIVDYVMDNYHFYTSGGMMVNTEGMEELESLFDIGAAAEITGYVNAYQKNERAIIHTLTYAWLNLPMAFRYVHKYQDVVPEEHGEFYIMLLTQHPRLYLYALHHKLQGEEWELDDTELTPVEVVADKMYERGDITKEARDCVYTGEYHVEEWKKRDDYVVYPRVIEMFLREMSDAGIEIPRERLIC